MSQERSLDGKAAVVTGASKGLGPHLAEALIAAGARVALLARASPDLEAVAERLGEAACAFACDVSDPDSVRRAMAGAQAALGRLDILVNNAAIAQLNRVEEMTDESIRREIGVNFMGPIYLMREAIPLMRAAGGGHIVNVSSRGVKVQVPYMSLYAATKGGLETLSASVKQELKADKIRVTVLRLGGVATGKGLARYWDEDKKTAYLAAAKETGLLNQVGEWMSSPSVARVLLDIVTTPGDVVPDFVEIGGR